MVARKIERVFRNSFQAKETLFYDHLVTHLFKNVLHRYEENNIYFAKRGSRERQIPLQKAIVAGIDAFEAQWQISVNTKVQVQAQMPQGEPLLSVIDYMNWAVYRAFTKNEMGYYQTVEHKVSLLTDLYDLDKYPHNWYNCRNSFYVKKSPLCS